MIRESLGIMTERFYYGRKMKKIIRKDIREGNSYYRATAKLYASIAGVLVPLKTVRVYTSAYLGRDYIERELQEIVLELKAKANAHVYSKRIIKEEELTEELALV